MEHELLKNTNCSFAEVAVTERNQEVVLHVVHYLKPVIKVFLSKLLLDRCIENLDVSLLEMVKFFFNNCILQLL